MVDVKDKFRKCQFVKGMHIDLNDSAVTELCGSIGFDLLWIDTEHSAIDYGCLQNHLIAAKAAGVASLVRIPWNDPILAKRVLEQGPDGIIFPVVNTAEELDKAMKATLYPPDGIRGFGPVRAAGYGLMDTDEYIREKSRSLIRCVQIESYLAVDNLEEMARNPWVDCFIFGPCDLSGSIGQLNNVFGDDTQALIRNAIDILHKAGKSIGVSTGSDDPNVIKQWHDLGINFISAGTDYLHILSGARKVFSILSEVGG